MENELEKNNENNANEYYVVREIFTASNGNEYYSYLLHGSINGRDVKVDFVPKDKGGYEVLDILFMLSDKAKLSIQKNKIDDNLVLSYVLSTTDSDGVVYECGVRPAKDSDKWLLLMLLNKNKKNK